MGRHLHALAVPVVLAVFMPYCGGPLRSTRPPAGAPPARLWAEPGPTARDLFNGPWGAKRAPDPHALYRLVEIKRHGVNPGMTVRDPEGRKWSVKQRRSEDLDESRSEVAVSRVLSAVGYYQPPVYYLPSFTLQDDWGTRVEPGGRFRLHDKNLKEIGTWSWQQNPFVGKAPYQGLLAVLMLLGSSDLKNSNNSLYEHRTGDGVELWYVVRDIGSALGSTGRFIPVPGDCDAFERRHFILGMNGSFLRFDYHGFHAELVRDRITPADVGWAMTRLGAIGDGQWLDAFRAAGFPPDVSARYVATLTRGIAEGTALAAHDVHATPERR
jgi:hypothetical protein